MTTSYNSSSTKPLYRGTQFIWYTLWAVETLLIFRFVLKLLGANAGATFTSFIYSVTHFLTAPFTRVFRVTAVDQSVFEWTTVLAIIAYWVLATAIIRLFLMSKTVSTPEAAVKLNDQE